MRYCLCLLLLFNLQLFAQSVLGIDVSHHQGSIDWSVVNTQGEKKFAWVKATEGMTYTDDKFVINMDAGINAGIIMGAYHFARPDRQDINSAVNDANNFLNVARNYIGIGFLPPVLDIENITDKFGNTLHNFTQEMTREELTTWAQKWIDVVESSTGVAPIIYINRSYANHFLSSIKYYGLWLAKFDEVTTPPIDIGVWDTWLFKQYSETGDVPGINGATDLDVFNGTFSELSVLINSIKCLDSYEPNNNNSDATYIPEIGKEFDINSEINSCLDFTVADEDWYSFGSTAQGELNITLTNQAFDFNLDLYSGNTLIQSSNKQSNGDRTLKWCSPGLSCNELFIKISTNQTWSEEIFDYTLELDWDYGTSCTGSKASSITNKANTENLTVSGNTQICYGGNTTLSTSGGSGNYKWYANGSEIGSGSSINISGITLGDSKITVLDLESPCLSGSITISVTNDITANAGQDKTISAGGSITLQGSGGSYYSWSPSTGLSNSNIWNPVASPTETTTYILTVTENGCSDTDNITIIVNDGSGGDTPPNDNCNDALSLNSSTSCSYTFGTIDHATDDGFPTKPTCDSKTNPNAFGVFYSFIAQSNSHTIKVNPTGELDAVITVYSGSNCYNLEEFDCEDTPGGNGVTTTLTNNNFTIGQEYWVRVYDYGISEPSIGEGGFNICITHEDTSGNDGVDLISNITNISNNNPDVGDTIDVTYTITNNGNENITNPFAVGLYLSTNQNFGSADAVFQNSTAGIVSLNSGETITFTKTITIPNENDGQYYILVNPDIGDNINEYSEDNNYDYALIQIGEIIENGPNLDIKGLDVVPNTNLAPGQEINVEIAIRNEGNKDSDRFVTAIIFDVGNDGNYDPNEDTVLGTKSFSGIDAGEKKTKDDDFYLPTNIPTTGTYQIIAIADFDNEINETDEDDNDKDEDIFISTLTPAGPDLIGSFIKWEIDGTTTQVSPQNLCLDTEYRLYWEITNIGNADVSGGFSISHRAVISKDEFYDGTDIFFDSRRRHAASHDVGEIVSIDDNNNWEGVAPGDYYLLIIADDDFEIDEIDEQNNVMAFPFTLNNCNNTQYPDLNVEITSYTPYSSKLGDYITVEMTISNIGNAPISNFDVELFLSEDQTFQGDGGIDTVNDHQLFDNGGETIQSILNPGEPIQYSMRAYTRTDSGLQGGINNSGIYYLFVSLDENGDYIELNRENNITYVPIELTSVDCYYNFIDEVKTITYNDRDETLFDVRTESQCSYTINAIEGWITYPKNKTITGNSNIYAEFEENPYPFPRIGHIDVNGEIFEFTQEAKPCELLEENLKLTISNSIIEEINCSQNGAIYIFVENGFPPYNFEWSNGQNNKDLTNVTKIGDYTVVITDAAGCSIEKTFTINNNHFLDLDVIKKEGVLIAKVEGATYQWLDCDNENKPIDGATTKTFTSLEEGNYAVEITTPDCKEVSNCYQGGLGVNNFTSTVNGVIDCKLGSLVIEVDKLNNYNIAISNNSGYSYSTQILENQNYVIIENLDAGKYALCFEIEGIPSTVFNHCVEIEITDESYIGDINNETFSFNINPISGCRLGNIYLTPRTRIDCHDYFITIRDYSGAEIYTGILEDNLNVENLESGTYTSQVYIENFPETTYNFDFSIDDTTSTSLVNSENFNVQISDIQECNSGKVTISPIQYIDCHEYNLLVKNKSNQVLFSGELTEPVEINNLDIGTYSYEIWVNEIMNESMKYEFEVLDATSTSLVNANNFNVQITDVQECDPGKVTISPIQYIDCHEYNLLIKNESNQVLFSGKLIEPIEINNLDIGTYSYEIWVNEIMNESMKFEFEIIDGTDLSHLNNESFKIEKSNVDSCNNNGSLSIINLDTIDCHPFLLTVKTSNGYIIQETYLYGYKTIDNLSVGVYTIEIELNDFIYTKEVFISDTILESSNNFFTDVYGNFNSKNGVISVKVNQSSDCRNHTLSITNQWGDNVYSGTFSLGRRVRELDKGTYTICIGLEGIPSNYFQHYYKVTITDDKKLVNGYIECLNNSPKIYINLPESSNNYYIKTLHENSLLIWEGYSDGTKRIDNANKYEYVTVGVYDPENLNGDIVAYNLFIDDIPEFVVNYDVLRDINSVELSAFGGIPPYIIEIYNSNSNLIYEQVIEEEFSNKIFQLENGVNYIKINHSEYCNDEFFEEVIVFDEYILFPNPSSDFTHIFIPNGLQHNNVILKFFSATGKLVLTKKFRYESNELKIDISHLASGMYIINLSSENNSSLESFKLIKK